MSRALTLQEAEYVAHQVAIQLLDYTDEPMPPFGTRYPHILESCLEQPFQQFAGSELLYPGIYRKAAVLFYLVTKNHPFKNGNKRMALTLTFTFLIVNGYSLDISTNDLYDLSLSVASDSEQSIDDAVENLAQRFESIGVAIPDITGDRAKD